MQSSLVRLGLCWLQRRNLIQLTHDRNPNTATAGCHRATSMGLIQVGVNVARSTSKRILCVSARGPLPVPVRCTSVGFKVKKKI